jgi:ubiquinone/menaquinone biosynthesis C-methylase UbiE
MTGMTGEDRATGRTYLTEQQYKDESNLAKRQAIYRFQQPVVDVWNGSLDLAIERGDEAILDVGCGNGMYLWTLARRRHRGVVAALDLSRGMLDAAAKMSDAAMLAQADAQQLPVRDAAFDVVLAMHMLYHVPDRVLAIRELRRVLRPDGVALVVTNSEEHLRELNELLGAAASTALGIDNAPITRNFLSFTVESGEPELADVFDSVELVPMNGELVITEVEPALDYGRSMPWFLTGASGDPERVIDVARDRVADVIDRDGALRVRTMSGCFVCR